MAISELKARLSEFLSAVRAGEELIVTDRGRPVARIAPVEGHREIESRVASLVRSGRLRPPTATRPLDVDAVVGSAVPDPEARTRTALLEERRTSR